MTSTAGALHEHPLARDLRGGVTARHLDPVMIRRLLRRFRSSCQANGPRSDGVLNE